MIIELVLGFFALSFVIQLIYLWLIFGKLAFYKKEFKSQNQLPVSVVIVSRNEYHNLLKTLEPILNQDYPEFEVVVVNDHSDDETHYFLKDLALLHPRLKVIQLDRNLNFFSGKKFPLSLGIKSAKYDTILLTDADCYIESNKWIESMQAAFEQKTQIVLGYGAYQVKKGVLNKIIRFDTLLAAMHYLSFAILKSPYMGVGRNLAYSKAMFYERKGFINHYTINSGDDDLFVNQAANKTNTNICIKPESFTYSVPERSLFDWLKQKKRHLSTSTFYKTKHRIYLSLYPFSLFVFYTLAFFLIFVNEWLIVVYVLLGIRLLSFLFIQKRIMQRLKEQKLFLLSPLLELFVYAMQALVLGLNIFNKNNKWK